MSFPQDPCNGLGAPKCLPLRVALEPNAKWEAVERCPGSTSPNKPGPGGLSPLQSKCLDYVDKIQGNIYYHVKMLSEDPIFGIGEVGGVAV